MIAAFEQVFGSAEGLRVYRAPGRVNLIGEHTDYNFGFVLPVALQLATFIGHAPGRDGRIRIYSEQHKEMREFPVAQILNVSRQGHWTDYLIGVAQELAKLEFGIQPADLYVRSTVPEGSGLSSSAALEVSSALALLDRRPLTPLQIAKLCQRAEVEFVGLPVGIMDQYISVFGKDHAAIEIDCRSLDRREVALPANASFITVNTMVKHALGNSAYRERVAECAAAVDALKRFYPDVDSLRDITPVAFQTAEDNLPDLIRRRARHVVTEDARVRSFVDASGRNDLAEMGKLMVASHRSLQNDYEVSCEELDFLVDQALKIEGVYGARMTGGGFGGCTVTLVSSDAADAFKRTIAQLYHQRFQIVPAIHDCIPSAGAGECKNFENFPALSRLSG